MFGTLGYDVPSYWTSVSPLHCFIQPTVYAYLGRMTYTLLSLLLPTIYLLIANHIWVWTQCHALKHLQFNHSNLSFHRILCAHKIAHTCRYGVCICFLPRLQRQTFPLLGLELRKSTRIILGTLAKSDASSFAYSRKTQTQAQSPGKRPRNKHENLHHSMRIFINHYASLQPINNRAPSSGHYPHSSYPN